MREWVESYRQRSVPQSRSPRSLVCLESTWLLSSDTWDSSRVALACPCCLDSKCGCDDRPCPPLAFRRMCPTRRPSLTDRKCQDIEANACPTIWCFCPKNPSRSRPCENSSERSVLAFFLKSKIYLFFLWIYGHFYGIAHSLWSKSLEIVSKYKISCCFLGLVS